MAQLASWDDEIAWKKTAESWPIPRLALQRIGHVLTIHTYSMFKLDVIDVRSSIGGVETCEHPIQLPSSPGSSVGEDLGCFAKG